MRIIYGILVLRTEKNTLKTKNNIKIDVKYVGDYGLWTLTQDKRGIRLVLRPGSPVST
jgi:hypothetical protein